MPPPFRRYCTFTPLAPIDLVTLTFELLTSTSKNVTTIINLSGLISSPCTCMTLFAQNPRYVTAAFDNTISGFVLIRALWKWSCAVWDLGVICSKVIYSFDVFCVDVFFVNMFSVDVFCVPCSVLTWPLWVNHYPLNSTRRVITCSAVAQHCVKAHNAKSMEKAKIRPPVKSEPLKFLP